MTSALPAEIREYLESPAGGARLGDGALWFRWNLQTRRIESSGSVLKSTPEQMSRPGTAVFVRSGPGGWKRYA